MSYGLQPEGFKIKRLDTIRDEIEESHEGVFGKGVDLSEDDPFGQIIGIYSERESLIWELLQVVYSSAFPGGALDANLDDVSSITGSIRKQATKSTTVIRCFGTAGTVIAAGSIVSQDGNPDAKFASDAVGTIGGGSNSIQQIIIGSDVTGGGFTLAVGSEITGLIAYNATTAAVKAALENLSGVDEVAVSAITGGYQVEFSGQNASQAIDLIVVISNDLENQEKTQAVVSADVLGNLHQKSFKLYDAAGSVGLWIDNQTGGGEPATVLGCDRQIRVTSADDASASVVAAAIAATLIADGAFTVNQASNTLEIIDVQAGARTAAADNDTGFAITRLSAGVEPGLVSLTITETQVGLSPFVDINFSAVVAGALSAKFDTLTIIETTTSGWNSATNLLDVVVGTDKETNAAFSQRRKTELALGGLATKPAIFSALNDLEGVTDVRVFSNTSLVVDPQGRPPRSLDIVIQGGDDAVIADKIFNTVAGGTTMLGDTSVVVFDPEGFPQTIQFSRPSDLLIYLIITVTRDTDLFPSDGADQILTNTLAYGSGLAIGADVIVFPQLICVFAGIEGITDVDIRIGTAANPTNNDNIVVDDRSRAQFDSSRIMIVEI